MSFSPKTRPQGQVLPRILPHAPELRLVDLPAEGGFTPLADRRDKLWDLSPNLHCSIVGTCLTTADLRGLMAKLGLPRAASEHDLHAQAVSRAARKDEGGKLLHKLLDRRHEREIQRFAKAGTTEEVRRLWRAALEKGEIPGAYWAVLAHPRTDRDLVKEVFGEVHMLSHLLGRSVRADLRRLADLEAEAKVQLDAIAALEERVAALTLSEAEARRREAERALDARLMRPAPPDGEEAADHDGTIARLRDQLARSQAKAAAEEERRMEAERAMRRLAEEVGEGARREAALQQELDNLEGAFAPAQDEGHGGRLGRVGSLAGLTLLYVGGRPRQVAQARLAIRNRGAELLTHDGGVDDAPTLLPGLVSRADAVLFPVDCVSHEAAAILKRCCRDIGRDFVPLRSASLASLLVALGALGPKVEA